MNGKIIADNIRAERNRVRLSQREAAEAIGVSERTYLKYEQEAKLITAIDLIKLADIFNCNLTDFYLNTKRKNN